MSSDTSGPVDGDNRPGMSPAKRKRLQQCFDHATQQLKQASYDYALDLLTQCVIGDPSNHEYIQRFLDTLKQKYSNNKKGDKLAFLKGATIRGAMKKCGVQKDWNGVFKHGLDMLKLNPWDVPALTSMANACKELHFGEAELTFLKAALTVNIEDPEVNKLCAQALGERKRYEEAITCWHRVEKARPGDDEAARAIASLAVEKTMTRGGLDADPGKKPVKPGQPQQAETAELSPEERMKRDLRLHPTEVPRYLELADFYLREDLFAKAEEVLAKAVEISKGDADVRERWEDAQLRRLRQQLSEAEKRAAAGGDKEKQAYAVLKQSFFDKDLEHCRNLVQRFPNNLAFKFDLGVRFQTMGRYNEAIAEFQAAKNDPRRKGLCMLALGQCFRHIKQYRLAMEHFKGAIQDIPDRDAGNKKKALYYAGHLALGLRDIDAGDQFLTALAGMDFSYRDVSALLDKIAAIRKNQQRAAPQAPSSADAGRPTEE